MQAIIWTNAIPILLQVYVALGRYMSYILVTYVIVSLYIRALRWNKSPKATIIDVALWRR